MARTNSSNKSWLIDRSQFTLKENDANTEFNNIYVIKSQEIEAQEYLINIPWFRYLKDQEIFNWRFDSELPISKVYHVSVLTLQRNSACISVFIQKFKNTLSSVTSLSIVNAIYLLKTSLTALQGLSKKYGYFKPLQDAIGITSKGDCKVWVNRDLAKNQVQQKCQNESQMVKSLFLLVKNKAQDRFKNDFLFCQIESQKVSFYKAQQLVTRFAYQKAIILPIYYDFQTKNHQFFQRLKVTKRKFCNQNRLSKSSFHGDFVPLFIKNSVSSPQRELQNADYNTKIVSGNNHMSNIKKFRSQDNNEDCNTMHDIQNGNFLYIPDLKADMKRSSQKTNKSTQGSTDVIELPEKINKFQSIQQSPISKKHSTLKLQIKNVFESSISDVQEFKVESCFVRKRSPTKNPVNKCVAASNCWSQTDVKEKEFNEENFQKNNWQVKINNLFDERDNDLKSSFHIMDNFDSKRQSKIDQLKRLKLNRFSGSQQIYQSIYKESPKGHKQSIFRAFD